MKTPHSLHKQEFAGDKKDLVHFLVPFEKRFIEAAVPHIPKQIETTHLTLMTIVWSLGIAGSGYLAQGDIRWLNVFSFCIFMQYITDMLDGAVGRARDTGLIKWGFYMDHFLDYVFLSSIVVGYSFLLPPSYALWSMACLAMTAGFMVHVLMDFAITNDFKISYSYFGVSEVRWVLIILNVVLMFTGKGFLINIFPYFVVLSFLALCVLVYRSQQLYGQMDIHEKELHSSSSLHSGFDKISPSVDK
jgi:phosphatidylglycerophosphate synthase